MITPLPVPLSEVPTRFPNPFATTPHPLAKRAAEIVQQWLAVTDQPHGQDVHQPGQGKMFGVLVVADENGNIGFLRAVSGRLSGDWLVPGFVPPLFDLRAREEFWPAGQRRLDDLARASQSHNEEKPEILRLHQQCMAKYESLRQAMRVQHHQRKVQRKVQREQIGVDIKQLDEESRADRRQAKALRGQYKQELDACNARIAEFEAVRLQWKRQQTALSNQLLEKLQAGYRIPNAVGQVRSLREFSEVVSGGSGDCAAPKLLGYALSNQLRPIAVAEFWWGATPTGGGRFTGQYYPACKGKCGPILPFMMEGMDVEPPPVFGDATGIAANLPITLYEDAHLVVIDKPPGLLSVPGRAAQLQDSVLTRLTARYPSNRPPLAVHRLDLDTSGVLMLAKHKEVHQLLQKLFADRKIEKQYVAWLDGPVAPSTGRINLPLTAQLLDRPRQRVDTVAGKSAITDYRVIETQGRHTKVRLWPRTGRTHQLRVHASHPTGLNAPILGDRLYGIPGPRLALHSEILRFTHPITGKAIEVVSTADSIDHLDRM